jgi:hypothetical protein
MSRPSNGRTRSSTMNRLSIVMSVALSSANDSVRIWDLVGRWLVPILLTAHVIFLRADSSWRSRDRR